MKDHSECERQFIQLSMAWYADANLPRGEKVEIITVGFYHPDGGTTGEFQISWRELGGRVVPKLEAFDDSWNALYNFSDLIKKMSDVDDDNISPEEFCKMLIGLGIKDVTQTKEA